MKLKTKIQLFSSLFMLLLVFIVNTSVYLLFYKMTTDNELEQLSENTNTIVETITENPDIPKNELLQAFLPSNGMIRVVDSDGEELIPTITKNHSYRQLNVEYSESENQQIIDSPSGEKVATISKPIIWEDGSVVTLQLSNYLLSMEDTMQTLFYVLLVASLLILIPAIIASNVLSRFILAPIKELIGAMNANMQPGNWKTIDTNRRSRDEIYEMETTFNDMTRQLQENFEKQEVFVSDASHELKTPIAIIKSYAQLLERRGKTHPEVFEEAVEAIDSESDRMQQLVEQMLLLAKDKEEAPHEEIDLALLIGKIIHTFTHAYERDINFYHEADDVTVTGNVDQIEQIIYILLDNAIKYSNKAISVKIIKKEGFVQIKVIDKGPGISEDDQLLIFDRFYRVDQSRARKLGGTGLGLSIAKAMAEVHHGSLSVQSTEGEGSIFILALPLK